MQIAMNEDKNAKLAYIYTLRIMKTYLFPSDAVFRIVVHSASHIYRETSFVLPVWKMIERGGLYAVARMHEMLRD